MAAHALVWYGFSTWCILQGNVILNRKWHLWRARWEVTGSWTGVTVRERLCITSFQAFSIQPGSQHWHKEPVTCTWKGMKSLPWSAEGIWPAPVHLGKPQPSLLVFLLSGCYASSQQPIVPILRLPGPKNPPSALPQAWRDHISRSDSHSWVCDSDVYTFCHSKSHNLNFCLWFLPLLWSDDWIEDRPPFVIIASLCLSPNFSRGFPPFFQSLHLHVARARLGHAAVLSSQLTVKFDPFAPVGPKLHETPDGKNDGRR